MKRTIIIFECTALRYTLFLRHLTDITTYFKNTMTSHNYYKSRLCNLTTSANRLKSDITMHRHMYNAQGVTHSNTDTHTLSNMERCNAFKSLIVHKMLTCSTPYIAVL